MTAPSCLLDASVCRVVGLPGLKYGSVAFLEISSFVLEKATCTDSVSSNSSFCLRGSLNSAKHGLKSVEVIHKSKETSHHLHILGWIHPFHCCNFLWIWTEPLGTPLVSKEGNLWKSELHLVWVQGQCILSTDFQKVHQMFVMFQATPPIDDHVISYACDSWNTKEDCIQFPLKNILCYNGTHWKSSPLKASNV